MVHAALTRRAVQRLADEQGLDLVHDHTLAGALNAPVYAAHGLPTVVTMHGPVNDDLRQLYATLGDDIHLVAISERQRQLAPELPWAGTVHNAVRLYTFPYRADKANYALFLGRFHPDKAPHLALDAAHAAGLPLVLAGKCAEPVEIDYFEREIRPGSLPATGSSAWPTREPSGGYWPRRAIYLSAVAGGSSTPSSGRLCVSQSRSSRSISRWSAARSRSSAAFSRDPQVGHARRRAGHARRRCDRAGRRPPDGPRSGPEPLPRGP